MKIVNDTFLSTYMRHFWQKNYFITELFNIKLDSIINCPWYKMYFSLYNKIIEYETHLY